MMKKNEPKTTNELLNEISQKIDKLIASSLIHGKNNVSQIKILGSLGYSSGEIGEMIGLTDGNVRNIASSNKIK